MNKKLSKLTKSELIELVEKLELEKENIQDELDRLNDSYCDLEKDYSESIHTDDLSFDLNAIDELSDLSTMTNVMSEYNKNRFKEVIFDEFGLEIEIK